MSWNDDGLMYERILRGKVEDTEYNLKVSEQKYRQDKVAHETALRELKSHLDDQKFANFMKAVVK